MNTGAVSLGWIMQPALFDTPAGVAPGDIRVAREMVAANERHVALARAAGFDTIWVEDHMGWGDKAHLECFTHMAWLAGRHPGLRYGTMVCGQGFRNPAYLAKLAANMALLTDNRFILGIGAGNNPGEHREYGYPFAPPGERVAQTEEAIRICRALWTESPATFEGSHYRIHGAFSSPLPDAPLPLMVGGGGPRMLRLVARHADWWCADVSDVETFAARSKTLDAQCAAEGRDPASITRSIATWVSVEDDSRRATRWPDLHIVAGNPDEVAAELRAFREAGVSHFMLRFMNYPDSAGFERFVAKVLPQLG